MHIWDIPIETSNARSIGYLRKTKAMDTKKQKEQLYQIGVKGLIQNRENKILILKNRQKDFWDLPGGRVQEGENILDALLREIDEETGLKEFQSIQTLSMSLSEVKIPLNDHYAQLIFYYHHLILNLEQPIVLSNEHQEYRWVTVNMAKSLIPILPSDILSLIPIEEPQQG